MNVFLPQDAQQAWNKTMYKKSSWSHHAFVAAIFSLIYLVNLGWVASVYHSQFRYTGAFVIAMAFLLVMLNHYAYLFYQAARQYLQDGQDETNEGKTAMLRASYLGYRLYLVGLGMGCLSLGILAQLGK